jgi:hypothetical protein
MELDVGLWRNVDYLSSAIIQLWRSFLMCPFIGFSYFAYRRARTNKAIPIKTLKYQKYIQRDIIIKTALAITAK